jgi:hypothetical protein
MLTLKVPIPPVLAGLQVPPTTGLAVMLQQTPRAVTEAPPLEVTLPPLLAVVAVIPVIAVVVTVGTTAKVVVVNVKSLP